MQKRGVAHRSDGSRRYSTFGSPLPLSVDLAARVCRLLRCMSQRLAQSGHACRVARCPLLGVKAYISARIDHDYGSTGGAYGHPTRLAAKCVWPRERLPTPTPRTTVASVRCRSRSPPTRKLTTLRMAVTAITFWRTAGAAAIASTIRLKCDWHHSFLPLFV